MNLLEKFNQEQIAKLMQGKNLPEFRAGDTIRVDVRIIEGTNERIQAFEGLCIAIRHKSLGTSFIVRKISHNEGVERIFPLYSPQIAAITVVRRNKVRRNKLYYMRNLRGKSARLKEKRDAYQKNPTN